MKEFDTNIVSFMLLITQLTTNSLVYFFGRKGHISYGLRRWTFRDGNVAQVAQNFAPHFWVESIYLFVEGLTLFVGHFAIRMDTYIIQIKHKRRILSCTCTDIHWSSSEKSSFSKTIASVFSLPPIITFYYVAEIYLPLVQLNGHASPSIGYIEM